jgi:hypothetical protein
MSDWQPLQDIWEAYSESLDTAIAEGLIQDEELSEQYIWPIDLGVASPEQDDVKMYVHERMQEIFERIKHDRGLDPNVLANVIFRSVLCGMMWEKERLG